jgi:hypothetical protein
MCDAWQVRSSQTSWVARVRLPQVHKFAGGFLAAVGSSLRGLAYSASIGSLVPAFTPDAILGRTPDYESGAFSGLPCCRP